MVTDGAWKFRGAPNKGTGASDGGGALALHWRHPLSVAVYYILQCFSFYFRVSCPQISNTLEHLSNMKNNMIIVIIRIFIKNKLQQIFDVINVCPVASKKLKLSDGT